MPISGSDYITLAGKADMEARRAPSPEIRQHWEEIAKEFRKLAVVTAERELGIEPKSAS